MPTIRNNTKVSIPEHILEKAKLYYEETGSLSKTAIWISTGCPVDGIPTEQNVKTTRHPLARIFKEHSVHVKYPNGFEPNKIIRTGGDKKQSKKARGIINPSMRFLLALYTGIDLDLQSWRREKIPFMSACYFILKSPLHIEWQDFLGISDKWFLLSKHNIPLNLAFSMADQYERYEQFISDLTQTESMIYYNVWVENDWLIGRLFSALSAHQEEQLKDENDVDSAWEDYEDEWE